MAEISKTELRELIEILESQRARATELITVYIPAGYDLNKIISHLSQEQGTASNIKDKTTINKKEKFKKPFPS